MQEDESSNSHELEPQPSRAWVPPGEPPQVAAGIEDRPMPGPAGMPWRIGETLPIVLLLLLLGFLSMIPGPEPKVTAPAILQVLIFQTLLYGIFLLYIGAIVSLRHRLPFWEGLGWRPVNH